MRIFYAIYHNPSKKYLDLNQINKFLHLKSLNSLAHFYHEDKELLISQLQLAYSVERFSFHYDFPCFKPRKHIARFKDNFIPDYSSLSLVKYSWELQFFSSKKEPQFTDHKVIKTVLEITPLPLFQKVNLFYLMAQKFNEEATCINFKFISPLEYCESVIDNYKIDPNLYKVIKSDSNKFSHIRDAIDLRQPKPMFHRYEEEFSRPNQDNVFLRIEDF